MTGSRKMRASAGIAVGTLLGFLMWGILALAAVASDTVASAVIEHIGEAQRIRWTCTHMLDSPTEAEIADCATYFESEKKNKLI